MAFIHCNTMRATSPKILYEVDVLKRQSHWRKGVFSKVQYVKNKSTFLYAFRIVFRICQIVVGSIKIQI
jgi:hypothetical protein